MALSQVQCLDDNHINLRTNESKPDFFYSEGQRLALETLIREGRDAFEDHIKTNNIRWFLSDLELERILNNVEVYSPGDNAEVYGESDAEEVSLQYWPDLSDYSIPQLDIGWPNWASYRGVTRVQVYTQPLYDGQPHIKEVVRKMIGQAQKVVAVVMDLFTDIDIFKDVLDASYRRKVAVYILLDSTGVTHFLRMCDKAGMHAGHLKNLRVRSFRGAEFFSRCSKRVCGTQSQKFMFIDGDKALSGSYSFTWSASRLDRNLITVLTGQVVEIFDRLFQDMYVMSDGVCLSRIDLDREPEPEILPQAVPALFPPANTAFKLINPKYTLVSSCTVTTNGPDQTNQKESVPHVPPVHPGLLNLEKANMIHYVPTWPDPEPPSDVIGFINIRDTNKPLQAHLMRSELGVSQAIRFKDSSEPKEPVMAHPLSEELLRNAEHLHQNQHQGEDLISVHVLTGNREDEDAPDVMITDNESVRMDSSVSLNAKDDTVSSDTTKQTPDAPQHPVQPPNNPPSESNKPYCDVDTHTSNTNSSLSSLSEYYDCFSPPTNQRSPSKVLITETPSDSQSHNQKTIQQEREIPRTAQDSLDNKQVLFIPKILKTSCSIIFNYPPSKSSSISEILNNESALPNNASDPAQTRNGDSNFSSTSEEYFECSDTGFEYYNMSNVNDLNQNELHDTDAIPAVTLQIQKLTEISMQEDEERRESSCQNMTEAGSVIEMMVNGHLEANDPETEHDSHQTLTFMPQLTPKMILEKQSEKLGTEKSELSLDFMCKKSEKQPILDLQLEELRTENPLIDLKPEVNLDLMYEGESVQITEKAPVIDFQPEVNVHLICDGQHVHTVEKTEKLLMQNSESGVNPDLMCKTECEQKTEELLMQDSQSGVNPDLMCKSQCEQKTEELLMQDSQSGVNLDLMCKSQCEQKTEELLMQDSQSGVNPDLMCKSQCEQKTEELLMQDSQSGVNPDLMCKSQCEQKTEKQLNRDLKPEVNLDLMCKSQCEQKTEKQLNRDLKPEVNLDLMCKSPCEQKTEKPPMTDLQPDLYLDLMCERESEQTAEKAEKQPQLDLQTKLNLRCEGQSEKTEQIRDLQQDLNLDLTHEKTAEPSLADLQLEINHNLIQTSILNSSELKKPATGGRSAVTPVKPEKTAVTMSIHSEKQQNIFANLDLEPKHPHDLKSADHVNEIKIRDVEVSQTEVKDLKLPEDFEMVELLILEDSDLQEMEGREEKKRSHLRKTKTAPRTEAKLHKSKPSGLKTVRKPTEFELYSKHGKHTCPATAPVKIKEERERVSAIQVKKNLPEAKLKLDCQVRKQPHQTSNRIPTATQSELHITKPHIMNRSKRHEAPEAETQAPIQSKPCSPEKLPTGETTTLKSHQIQRHPVHSSNASSSQPKLLKTPRTTQSDQHVSRKHSAPTVSPSGTSFPRQIKNLKQTFRDISTRKKK